MSVGKEFMGKLLMFAALSTLSGCQDKALQQPSLPTMNWATPDTPSLSVLSIDALRQRQYGSEFQLINAVDYQTPGYQSYMASYNSDGLKVYARIDIPDTPMPDDGYPVLLYSHGWVGEKNAPNFNFFLDQQGSQARYISAMAKQGLIVITPGWRGHGTVNDTPAKGIEFVNRWDNASYISPIFYAIDMLNALDSVPSIEQLLSDKQHININSSKVFIAGHSQGGDAALLTLAIAGEGSPVKMSIAGASIFAGCFLPRIKQGELYGSMATSPQAFMAGDDQWNGTATGINGEINPDFQFPFPPDWIGTTDTEKWTWQKDSWSLPTVREAFAKKYSEMYQVLKKEGLNVGDFQLEIGAEGQTVVIHPEAVKQAYQATSAIAYPQYLQEPLTLHHSDQDYYSPSFWNQKLVKIISDHQGFAINYEYPENTHSLTLSQNSWFSSKSAEPGLEKMIARDIKWFSELSKKP
ncbi:alpha/beta hydrolase family protein [Thalassotalea sp. PS06]|uniref:alpha/beta hydrolase family protein n=1 Tax=Thalassotalea sp. PS06 TaxID=2594005 RepID=UPI0021B13126|nr:alpha/beta hydrolase [Thalassotalea sp. PS06]